MYIHSCGAEPNCKRSCEPYFPNCSRLALKLKKTLLENCGRCEEPWIWILVSEKHTDHHVCCCRQANPLGMMNCTCVWWFINALHGCSTTLQMDGQPALQLSLNFKGVISILMPIKRLPTLCMPMKGPIGEDPCEQTSVPGIPGLMILLWPHLVIMVGSSSARIDLPAGPLGVAMAKISNVDPHCHLGNSKHKSLLGAKHHILLGMTWNVL